ncbi:MAG: DUF3747 domain-containing protein [Cyanobacteriota bacterium]|nr:DUF3747 domain-containing protein [Cyanobacteriota bacterium]
MKRPYLALATFALVAGLTPGEIPRGWATGLFSSAPVEPASFAVLARPVADDDWSLVVLEQLKARPFCWTPRPDGLVDPSLNRFNYTGVCGRFIDSNGYSLRIGDVDLNHAYRLRIERRGGELQLLATSASRGAELLVGRGPMPRRDRDLFVSLQLEPGWELRRRMFGDRSLNHVYFSNGQPLESLIAAATGRRSPEISGAGGGLPQVPPLAPPPLSVSRGSGLVAGPRGVLPTPSQRFRSPTTSPESNAVRPSGESGGEGVGAGVVALQVIPYDERTATSVGSTGNN